MPVNSQTKKEDVIYSAMKTNKIRAGDMAQMVKRLAHKHKDRSSIPSTHIEKWWCSFISSGMLETGLLGFSVKEKKAYKEGRIPRCCMFSLKCGT